MRGTFDSDEIMYYLKKNGYTYKKISFFFGVSRQRVHQIVSRFNENNIKLGWLWRVCKPPRVRYYKPPTPEIRYYQYKYGANKRNIDWNLSYEQFMLFWKKPCSYCGSPVETIGLDRIDSLKGYTIDNVVPCCGKRAADHKMACNIMKSNASREEFIDHCYKIVNYQNSLNVVK